MKSAEDFAAAVAGMAYRSDRREAIKARDAELTQEVVERCANVATRYLKDCFLDINFTDPVSIGLLDTIRAVAKPPETPRERLGRVLCERTNPDYAWSDFGKLDRDIWCDRAEAVRQEIAKMEAEG